MRRRISRPAGVLVGALLLAGCGGDAPAADRSPAPSTTGVQGTLTVFAAASLKTTFTALGATFEAENPGVAVTFGFAGSSDLVTQLTDGAPADVFAAADTATMDRVVAAGLAADPVAFARNTLVIVTPPDNPAAIASFGDLAGVGVSVVVCADAVPCGSATARVEDATGVRLTPVSEEQSVTDVLNKVRTGEADAGLVYVTDARAAGDAVHTVPFAESGEAVNTYPIAALTDAADPTAAAAFIALVTGTTGRAVLADAGFAPGA
ncbi:molybdate ABC transporter substrate-binding protein [Nakamurella deserti]|uniref:molybdate ABC transporter substrate-binding protein n=1 Tax=Nakamurella deserti TaxID=2164074 RepID=UPI001F0B8411|nr:molybdate ABC transporter substrate-binding protein [Nakamurella deserti]